MELDECLIAYALCLLFRAERQVISRQSERQQQQLQLADSPEDLKQGVIARMKSVTNADEDVCVAILEDNKYDLKASLDAFFQT